MYVSSIVMALLEKRNEETDVTLETSTPSIQLQHTTEHRVIANNLG